MTQFFKFSAVLICIVFFASCGEEDIAPEEDIVIDNNGNNPSDGDGGGAVDGAESTYFPIAAGNTWVYEGDISYTFTLKDEFEEIEGKEYQIAESVSKENGATQISYVREENGSVFTRTKVPLSNDMINFEILKSSAGIGDEWQSSIEVNSFSNAIYRLKLVAKDASRTVNDIVYKDIIAIEMATFLSIPQFEIDKNGNLIEGPTIERELTRQITYYAKNVGMIEQTSDTEGLNIHLVSKKLN